MKKVAVFASGRGSNAIKIIENGAYTGSYTVDLIITNRQQSGILNYARENKIAHQVISKSSYLDGEEVLSILETHQIDFIALAGFLWLIPPYLIERYSRKIINIHPALLPAYGGKGMYGHHIHEAVKANGEKQSGITIHYVSEAYDEGQIILQASTLINEKDNADEIATKVLKLEHYYFPKVVAAMTSRLH